MRTDLIDLALGEIGVEEQAGPVNHSPRILEYFQATNHQWVKNDELAWCAAFINWLAWSLGLVRTGELNARSWLETGIPVENPERGDLVIYWRKKIDSPWGHVGLWVNERDGMIQTLGGNQSNKVGIDPYPKSRVLGYRYLPKA